MPSKKQKEVFIMKRYLFVILTALILLCSSCREVYEPGYEAYPDRIVRIDGRLYYDSGHSAKSFEPRCGTYDGKVKRSVADGEIPSRDDTSNFQGEHGYQHFSETQKLVNINGNWVIFERYYDWGIDINVEKASPESITLSIVQSGGNVTGELSTGEWYDVEYHDGRQWRSVKSEAEGRDTVWHCIAYSIPKNGECILKADFTTLFGKLSDGGYRIAKKVQDLRSAGDYDEMTVYAYFTLQDTTVGEKITLAHFLGAEATKTKTVSLSCNSASVEADSEEFLKLADSIILTDIKNESMAKEEGDRIFLPDGIYITAGDITSCAFISDDCTVDRYSRYMSRLPVADYSISEADLERLYKFFEKLPKV